MKIIRKLLLVKEIVSKTGLVHFQRWRLLRLPWFAVYVHHICRSDADAHMHSHPWSYISFILEGAYTEEFSNPPYYGSVQEKNYYSGDLAYHKAQEVHKLTLISDQVWSLVMTWGRTKDWGYATDQGFVGHKEYRQLKNEGKWRK
jgi:hypothetical protein